jgi:hypothetical protein
MKIAFRSIPDGTFFFQNFLYVRYNWTMIELTTSRKNKINFSDYPVQQDVECRVLLAESSVFDLEVLEAILFSPLKILIKKLAQSLESQERDLHPILQKLSAIGLIQLQNGLIQVDKERRKYFEFQIGRFGEDFKPNIDFLQGLLKLVPIQVLPSWYAIPRTANSIFESIVEKMLANPQVYERVLDELHVLDPICSGLVGDLLAAPSLQLLASEVRAKYGLSQEKFQELMIQLEFRFLCFTAYRKEQGKWQEWVVPLYEWQRHLLFLRKTEPPVLDAARVAHPTDEFSVLKKMEDSLIQMPFLLEGADGQILEKLVWLRLAEYRDGKAWATEGSKEWLRLSLEQRAILLYRNPSLFGSERNVREGEKIIKRVLHGKWVLFEDLLRGAQIGMSGWMIPKYTEAEIRFLKALVFDWLFSCNMVRLGTYEKRTCLAVTPFGQNFFEE